MLFSAAKLVSEKTELICSDVSIVNWFRMRSPGANFERHVERIAMVWASYLACRDLNSLNYKAEITM